MSNEQSFIHHLIELRDRLIRAIGSVLLIFLLLIAWRNDLFSYLSQPLLNLMPQGQRELLATGPISSFMIPVKLTFMVSFVIMLPYVLWQMWGFIAPGLYQHEKKLVIPLISSSYFLFLVGMAFAYFLVLPVVFGFILSNASKDILVKPDIEAYFDFVMNMFLAFGLTFETPIVVIVLVKMGIVSIADLVKARPYIIVGAFVVAAIITPPDVISQLLLAIPLCLLFELGLLVSRWITPATDEDKVEAIP